MSTARRVRSLATVLAAMAVMTLLGRTAPSGASYTARSASPTGTITAAADWTPPTVVLVLPAGPLTGTVTATGSVAETGSGLASVELLRAPTGTQAWTSSPCTAAATTTCHLDTTRVPDGIHDFVLRASDLAGNVGQSPVVTREVRSAPVRAVDIQAVGTGNFLLGAGDVFLYTYSHVIAPGSLLSGWDGSTRNVVVRTTNNRISGRASDHIDLYTDNSWRTPIQVGTLELGVAVMSGLSDDLTFNGTITAETVTVDGRPATRVRLNVGTWRGAGLAQLVLTAHQMTWYPSTAARDLSGVAVAGTPVAESGPADNDL